MLNRLKSVQTWIYDRRSYFIAALLPAALLLCAYVFFGIYPFGKRSVLALDLNAQYVYYFDYMRDVLSGKESLFYSWSGSLSGEFFGTFAYYLASPFNFIVWAFPRACITEGIMAMLLVKSAAVGFTSAVYLKKQRGFSDFTVILFAVSFALCGYFMAHTLNPMWLDGLIALPLVIMGVERICDKKKFLLYTLSLLYIFIANFYIGYMVGIFSALYFAYYLASGYSKVNSARGFAKSVLVYGLSSVSAIMLACPVLIPVFKALHNGKISGEKAKFSPAENFNIADIFIKLFPTTYDTERPEGLPMLYCGTLTLIFAAVYFVLRKIPLRRRIASGFMIGIMVLSMYIKPIDMLWHGGQVPVWMPYRYAFTVVFLLVIFGAEAFENIESTHMKTIGSVFFLLFGILLFCDYYEGNSHFDTKLVIVIPMIALGIFAAFLAAYRNHRNNVMNRVLIGLVCAELLMNSVVYLRKMHSDVYYSERTSYVNDIPKTREIIDQLREYDKGFYRSEKTYHRTVNDPMAVGLYGVSHSTSVYNEKALELLRTLGYGARDHYSRYDGATMITDDIFGFKYVLSKDERFVPYSETVSIENDSGVTVYKNSDAFGLAFLADSEVNHSMISGGPFAAQEKLAGFLTGNYVELYHPITDSIFGCENINIGSTTDGHISYKKRIKDEQASISYDVEMPESGRAYLYFPTDYERNCELYLNGEDFKRYFNNENHTIVCLGEFAKGESFTAELKLLGDDVYIKEAQFFYTTDAEISAWNAQIRDMNENTTVIRTGKSELEINVKAVEDQVLFTSIPYEEGWSAEIDGKKAEVSACVNRTLMCIEVPPGEHKITLKFTPAGMKQGLICFGIGAVILAVLIVLNFLPKKEKPEENDE